MVRKRYFARYLTGAAAARTGDEMSGPALLLLGFAVTRTPGLGSALLASLTAAAAGGGPVFGALLDRSPRPGRLLALTLAGYALGITAVMLALGRLPEPAVLAIALLTGLFGPAVAGGWTSRVPDVVPAERLPRASALDAISYNVAGLAGPALAATVAAGPGGARFAVGAAAVLVAAAAPAALALPRAATAAAAPARSIMRQFGAGFAAIARRRALLRATVSTVLSCSGLGMLLVCAPLLGAHRLGGAARGALLVSAVALVSLLANAVLSRKTPNDTWIPVSALVLAASMAAAAVAPSGLLTIVAVAAAGAGEGPQLTALFAVRHREAPAGLRGQIFTTGASLKIGGLAAGAALAGPLAAWSLPACLLVTAAIQLTAAVAWAVIR